MLIASIASGSNGNCYYVANEREAVLIDAGISFKELQKRLLRMNLNPAGIKAIFISHEHIDHVRGVEGISKKLGIPVYITDKTFNNGQINIREDLRECFEAENSVCIGDLEIIPFSKKHDAADPHSFLVKSGELSVAVLTDIGVPCDRVKHYFSHCDAAFLETNYDDQMLSEGRYPEFLKARISGDAGHLSNVQALELLMEHGKPELKLLFLSHLSKDNNHPDLVRQLFLSNTKDIHIEIASRYEESRLFGMSRGEDGFIRLSVLSGQLSAF